MCVCVCVCVCARVYVCVCVYVCTVTLPSRRASIRPGNHYGARAERPRQKEIASAVSKSPERRVLVMFCATVNLYFFCIILYVGQPAGKPPGEEEEGFFCDNRHGAHGFRTENGDNAGESGQRRVAGEVPSLQIKGEKQQRNSCLGPR